MANNEKLGKFLVGLGKALSTANSVYEGVMENKERKELYEMYYDYDDDDEDEWLISDNRVDIQQGLKCKS